MPYSLFPISIAVIFFYTLSFVFSKQNIFKPSTHRKIWNIFLLCTFLVTGILGLTMVIKINYKLDIPFYEKILKWHVEFGIGMACVAFFHIFWHLKYFLNIFKTGKKAEESSIQNDNFIQTQSNPDKIKTLLKIPAFLTGFTSLSAQIIMVKEFLNVFYCNELVIGIILANWFLITAAGSYLGRFANRIKNKIQFMTISLFLLVLLPVCLVFITDFLKYKLFPLGEMIGIFRIFYSSFFILLPLCLISGMLFTMLATFISDLHKDNRIIKTYAYESVGSIAGGVLFSLILVYFFNTFQSLLIILIIATLILLYFFYKIRSKYSLYISIAVSLISAIALFTVNLDKTARSYLFPNQKLIKTADTPIGNLTLTENMGQKSVFENSILLFDTENDMLNEESVHFAMIQHPNPQHVLLISGGVTGRIKEILKYPVKHIDYVELNPSIIKFCKEFLDTLNLSKVSIIKKDPCLFIKTCKSTYDVILINLPEPSSLQLNRFYSIEFFHELKNRLNNDGVVSFNLLSTANYLNHEAISINSTMYNTALLVFKNVIILPGEKNYFLLSDNPLKTDIARMITEKQMTNNYVNQYYIDDSLIKQRSDYIHGMLNPDAAVNTDLKPISYYQQVIFWLSQYGLKFNIVIILLIVLFLFSIISLKPVGLGIFSAGFSASSIQLLLITGFQIISGNIHFFIGILFTAFMVGLAIGSYFQKKILPLNPSKGFIVNLFIIGLFSICYIIILNFIKETAILPVFIYLLFFIFSLITGLMTGLQFSFGTGILKEKVAVASSGLYSADLLGSAFGAILISILLIPLMGIVIAGIITGILNFVIGFYLYLRKSYE